MYSNSYEVRFKSGFANEISTILTIALEVGLGVLPEAVPTVAAQMVARIAIERMVIES